MKIFTLFSLLVLVRFALGHRASLSIKHYIVYMGHNSKYPNSESTINANHEVLASIIGSHDGARNAALHHYTKTFRGFSAMLTRDQAAKLAEHDTVLSVFQSKTNKIHTTRSWDFLGLNNLQNNQALKYSTPNIIVGVIDSGIWPESKSFNSYGLGPVPAKFKGECSTGENFTSSICNRKIAGARFYSTGFEAENGPLESFGVTFFRSARDSDGHGTHTASTIAGSPVDNVSLLGIGRGTASGGAISARLAIYKACWFGLCSDADILAAFDDAINDGVDIISMSLGPDPPQPIYFGEANSIGSFHAFEKGIVVSASAGNSVFPRTATNVAPWILTVAASTMDREIQTNIYLGNSKVLKGFSINPTKMDSFYGLIVGSMAAAPGVTSKNASFCKNNTLDPKLIKGKIVVCTLEVLNDNRREKGDIVKQGGGVGVILVDPLAKDIQIQFVLPGALIGQEEAAQLQAYMAMEKNPVAKIYQTITVLPTKPAPEMAMFSSMGPNVITPDIIKPDITAPGVNVLAAWSPVSTDITAGRSLEYNIISGTSMSCPHVSALAAIVKSFHPSWSPAAIKSAIMTTDLLQADVARSGPCCKSGSSYVAGPDSRHISCLHKIQCRQLEPDQDICTGANPAQLKNLTGHMMSCKNTTMPPYDFNYPSIGVSNMKGSLSVHRTVTYYGKGPSVYKAQLDYPDGVKVSVVPSELRFKIAGDTMSFRVDFTPYKTSGADFVFGALTWTNGIHRVRSPIGINVLSV